MDEYMLTELVRRLPEFDPAWPLPVQQRWYHCFICLWRWGCRLTVEYAVDNAS